MVVVGQAVDDRARSVFCKRLDGFVLKRPQHHRVHVLTDGASDVGHAFARSEADLLAVPAADHLLDIIRRDSSWKDDAAKYQLLKFFEAWGFEDPTTMAVRRKLSALLFS